MTRTYADITVGSIVDGEIIATREIVAPAAGDHAEIIRLTTKSGGARTEAGDRDTADMLIQHLADPTLVDVAQEPLEYSANWYADLLRREDLPLMAVEMTILQGMALELNRRRALECIARRCVCHGKGH